MNLKKSIAIGLAAMALFASFGCGNSGKQSGSGSSQSASVQQKKIDEATIKNLAKKFASSNMEDRKAAYPVEKLPTSAFLKTPLKDDSSTLINFSQPIKFDNLSISNIKQSGDYASAQASYTNANNQQANELWIFRNLDGKWVFDMLGIKTSKPLKVSGYDETKFEVALNGGFTYENELVLAFDVRSKTTTNYFIGAGNQPSYVLITDKGEFPAQNTGNFYVPVDVFQITSAQPIRLCIPFKGAIGKPKAIRFLSFNELDSRGLPINPMTNDEMTFTLSE